MSKSMAADAAEGSDDHEVQIHVDVLETIFSYVPLINLESTSRVSRPWHSAVRSSLRCRNKPKPWLILHVQSTRRPHHITTRAYDPRSDHWMVVSQLASKHASAIRSACSNLAYMISDSSRFSFSFSQLDFDWCHVDPPRVWRVDPIVARVGVHIVIGGGICEFEDDSLAVECYSLELGAWNMCESMPEGLKDSVCLSSLSIATTNDKLIVTVKKSGLTYWFDPTSDMWSESIVLDPGESLSSYHIGYSSKIGLVLIGVRAIGNVEGVKVWRVREGDFYCEKIGEMPRNYVEKLRSESWEFACMDIRMAGDMVYVYNTEEVEEIVVCKLEKGGQCVWWSVRNVVVREDLITNRLVYSCSDVRFEELGRINDRRGVGM